MAAGRDIFPQYISAVNQFGTAAEKNQVNGGIELYNKFEGLNWHKWGKNSPQ